MQADTSIVENSLLVLGRTWVRRECQASESEPWILAIASLEQLETVADETCTETSIATL
jgi:hypothetical protein